MDNQLRILAGAIVTDSKMSKESKFKYLNFIQNEASLPQIKALLLDGEIVFLDEEAEKIVNMRFNLSERTKAGTIRKTVSSVTAAASGLTSGGVGTGIWALYRTIAAAYGTCTKKCGTYKLNLPERQACMDKCKAAKKQKMAAAKAKAKK